MALATALPAPAYADAIPDATYSFLAPGGESVTFTVSADGTIVNSYNITAVGQEAGGNTCDFHAEGDSGVWQGAPIVNDTFQYSLGDDIIFDGQFTGAQSAAGTFRLYDPPLGSAPACDTGTLDWTATTTATPPGQQSTGSGSGAGGSGSGGGGKSSGSGSKPGAQHAKATYRSRVTLRKASRVKFVGQITVAIAACRADRTVTLWIGPKRAATTRSRANGSFSFRRSAATHGEPVRASASRRNLAGAICAAGTSRFIGG
ncbi:MAG: hypothetical protein ACLP0J_06365 [Solirubrobacteraceae bacterium]